MSLNDPDTKTEITAADPKRWLTLGVLMIAQFMYIADVTVVYVAVPAIQIGLKANFAQVQMIVTGYSLAYAVALITGGRLGDIFGRKRTFLSGLAGFILASALCSLAITPDSLIVARVFQGLTAALMMPQVLSIIQVSFPAHERGSAFGIFGAVIGLASTASLPLSSILIDSNVLGLGWRNVFLINVPIGLGALLAATLMRESRSPVPLKLDWVGVVLVTIGLFSLVYPLVEGREAGWPLWAFLCMILAVLTLIVFILYERYRLRRNASALVELSLFANRNFVIGLLSTITLYSGFVSFYLLMTIYLQSGLRFTVLQTGFAFTPLTMVYFVASITSVRLSPKLGSRLIAVGGGIMAVSVLLIIAIVHQFSAAIPVPILISALSAVGVGQGLAVPVLINATLAMGIKEKDAGSASGILTTVQQISGAFGVAVIGIIFFGILGVESTARSLQTYNYALSASLLCNAGLFGLTFLFSFLLPRNLSGSTKTLKA